MRLDPARTIERSRLPGILRRRDVAVIGAGRSGLAAIRRLAEMGAQVRLADAKSRAEMARRPTRRRTWA